jgi:thiamine biosynthesis lipoprotein
MDTLVTQIGHGASGPAAIAGAETEMLRLERLLSFYSSESDVGKLNLAAGSREVSLSAEAIDVLGRAKALAEATDGAFDPTIGPLVRAWRAARAEGTVPSPEALRIATCLVDHRDLRVDAVRQSAGLRRTGQAVDLGGIAKGYIADRMADVHREAGVTSGLINAGGDIVAVGSRPDGRPWRIGLQHPRRRRGRWFAVVPAANQAVVTSGDYERYHEVRGTRYHHLLDARTGYPAISGLISVTVIAERAVDADALATAVFVLGADAGVELVRRIGSCQAVLVTGDGTVLISKSLTGRARIGCLGRRRYF